MNYKLNALLSRYKRFLYKHRQIFLLFDYSCGDPTTHIKNNSKKKVAKQKMT